MSSGYNLKVSTILTSVDPKIVTILTSVDPDVTYASVFASIDKIWEDVQRKIGTYVSIFDKILCLREDLAQINVQSSYVHHDLAILVQVCKLFELIGQFNTQGYPWAESRSEICATKMYNVSLRILRAQTDVEFNEAISSQSLSDEVTTINAARTDLVGICTWVIEWDLPVISESDDDSEVHQARDTLKNVLRSDLRNASELMFQLNYTLECMYDSEADY
jgi:hypothetical protein